MMSESVAEASFAPYLARRQVAAWLFVCAALVFAVTVLGGVTRLNHAGLSIVEWQPIAGVLPPMSDGAWQAEFERYQEFPEYRMVHPELDLAGFKGIFWLEYLHRLLARAVGVAFAVPLAYFVLARKLRPGMAWKLGGVLVLGGLQGALGWWMVASGLVDRPDVSHYRLAAHLGLAMAVYAALVWLALSSLIQDPIGWGDEPSRGLRRGAAGAVAVVFVLMVSGALVAGLDAGLAFNTFPTMNGDWIPPGLLAANPLESIAGVQFLHRWLGVAAAAYLLLLWGRALDARLPGPAMAAFHAVVAVLAVQGSLGVFTLLRAVPVTLAAAHQAAALVLLAAAVTAAFVVGRARIAPAAGIRVLP